MEHLKSVRVGRGLDSISEAWDCKSSPRRHCPQKAVTAQAATTASNGELRSRLSMSYEIILGLTGGRGECLEAPGARFQTPLRI